ncbi:DegT/DnrJ/EryC1/StrS family aminotransferase [Conexibacter sp. W3-3-2]|uniref:DegT/DnrJ/EryC1/StrS family aminotransferase n=1 Tax=Conexibacter sp. W3-3-2 TaxID=2675227 RepID=UPI0012B8C3DC|nr:DegT/DnrJ/EryC1/StrS family aminotransferase [Conexibacter sp. W3-3-2]MTD45431.1 DegT/DnrJ/EryC1/StrS family aminotransferase [Conexibacter sp. W3-3-2]
MPVPLFDPATPVRALRGALREAVDEVLDSEHYILGSRGEAFEREFADYLGVPHAAGVANGTEAITIALRALGVGPGDDVVVPSFTFWASAEAIPPTGARPVFCDVDPHTMCVTPETVKAALTPNTKAVIAVHLFGNVAPVREIAALGVPVLEDSAQSAGSTARGGGRPGGLGTIATFSFYPSKNLGAFGDGGAITTTDAELDARVRTLRFHGSEDKVTYTDVGYNSRLDELQAAILRVQLPALDGWAAHRAQVGAWYAQEGLGELVTLPRATDAADRVAWHLYVIGTEQPDALAAQLTERGVGARGYYRLPVHRQPAVECLLAGGRAAVAPGGLPGTEEAARRHLAIPISAATTREQVAEVVAAVRDGLGALG